MLSEKVTSHGGFPNPSTACWHIYYMTADDHALLSARRLCTPANFLLIRVHFWVYWTLMVILAHMHRHCCSTSSFIGCKVNRNVAHSSRTPFIVQKELSKLDHVLSNNLPLNWEEQHSHHFINKVLLHVCLLLPSLVCAFVICRSQSPALSFSLLMICLFRSLSVVCGPSNTTVS